MEWREPDGPYHKPKTDRRDLLRAAVPVNMMRGTTLSLNGSQYDVPSRLGADFISRGKRTRGFSPHLLQAVGSEAAYEEQARARQLNR